MICAITFSMLLNSAPIAANACGEFKALPREIPAPSLVRNVTPCQTATAHERDLAVRTVFGEASDEPEMGQVAVAAVICNRTAFGDIYGGPTVKGVLLKRYAFEPWLHSHTRARMMGLSRSSREYQDLRMLVNAVFDGDLKDPTHGSTHFYSPISQAKLGRRAPDWGTGKPKAVIGGHRFYKPPVETARN